MISRTLAGRLKRLAKQYPVLFLTGPRQSGKTTLARSTFPRFRYVNLEDLQSRREADEDPRGFLRRLEGAPGAVLDEVQRVPDLFSYIQGFADEERGGPLVLTGSQQFLLQERIGQSLAGRTAILELLPFSMAELTKRKAQAVGKFGGGGKPPAFSLDDVLFSGMFPRIHDRGLAPPTWLDGYLRTYVERDVRTLAGVGDLDTFVRFLGLCAGRAGQLLNTQALGSEAGITHTTARRWLSILRAAYIVDLLPPHHENFSKRLVKTPKLYFLDTGLLCRLLGLRRSSDLHLHPLRGAIFENFVVSEFKKRFLHQGQSAPLYFWRDSHGREVDLLLDLGTRKIPVEIKSGQTVASDFFRSLDYYGSLAGTKDGVLVYGGDETYIHRGHRVQAWWACT